MAIETKISVNVIDGMDRLRKYVLARGPEHHESIYRIYLGAWNRILMHKKHKYRPGVMGSYERHLDFALKQLARAHDEAACYKNDYFGAWQDLYRFALEDSGYKIGER